MKILRGSLIAILFVVLMGIGPVEAKKSGAKVKKGGGLAGKTQIIINVPSREMFLYHNNKLVFNFPVAVGQPRFKTPMGPRTMKRIVWNPWWIPPKSGWAKNDGPTKPGPRNPLGVVKMDLGGAILMHGTSKESSVGTAASHGCMRMLNANATTLAWWIQQHYGDKKDPELYSLYKSNRYRSHHVQLTKKIPVQIIYDVFDVEHGMMKSYPDIYWESWQS